MVNGFLQSGSVFWIILMLGLSTLVIFFNRLLHLRRAQIDYMDFIKGVCNVLDNGNTEEAIVLCEDTPGPVAAVAATAIRHRMATHEALREAVDNTGRAEVSRMERRLVWLVVTCQIAPLLGLVGTLLGVIRILLAMTQQAPLVQTIDLAGGLMQALASTVAGLMVMITCHVMYAMLMGRIERLVLDMEASASELVAYLTRREAMPERRG